jgi:formate dehydrogenase
LTRERIAKAPNLKLALTAGIGSDHVDLQAAIERRLTVAEVTYCNSISVSEHVVMMILSLVRNYIPSYQWVVKKGWNIADCVSRSYDLEGMTVGTVAAGRIGLAVLKRLKPFDVKLHYTDRHRLPESVEEELGLTFHPTAESMVRICDVVTINAPLHPETEHMFDDKLIGKMKHGSPMADDAAPWHDAAYLGNVSIGAGALCCGHSRDTRVLVRRPAHSQRVPHRRRRETGWNGRSFLQRGQCDRRL